MAKNGLLGPLQRRLLLADKHGALFQPPPNWPSSWLTRSKPASRARTLHRTFQAFRIFINAELEELQHALEASLDVLQVGGRLVVISFHSLEDRIVKQFIAKHSREVYDRRTPFEPPKAMKLRPLDRIKPSAAEVAGNPRSRSAIMRVAMRTAA